MEMPFNLESSIAWKFLNHLSITSRSSWLHFSRISCNLMFITKLNFNHDGAIPLQWRWIAYKVLCKMHQRRHCWVKTLTQQSRPENKAADSTPIFHKSDRKPWSVMRSGSNQSKRCSENALKVCSMDPREVAITGTQQRTKRKILWSCWLQLNRPPTLHGKQQR